MTSTIWPIVATERGALADDLTDLTDEQWDSRSLCGRWSVREVLAHMTSTATTGPAGFVVGMIRARLSFDRFVDADIERYTAGTPAETLARFRGVQHSTTAPPGPKASWLGETLVHAEDIRRPLGIAHDYPVDALCRCAEFYAGSNALIGTKSRISGLVLSATDTDWRHGDSSDSDSGADTANTVSGPMLSLLMAMTGRAAHCDDLTGDGVMTLRTRCHEAASSND